MPNLSKFSHVGWDAGWFYGGLCPKSSKQAAVSTVLEGFTSLSAFFVAVSLASVLSVLFVWLDASSWKHTSPAALTHFSRHAGTRPQECQTHVSFCPTERIGASSSMFGLAVASAAFVFSEVESDAIEAALTSVAGRCRFSGDLNMPNLSKFSHVGWDAGWFYGGLCPKSSKQAAVSTVLEGFTSLSAFFVAVSLASGLSVLFVWLDASSWKHTSPAALTHFSRHAGTRPQECQTHVSFCPTERIGASSSMFGLAAASAAFVF